MYKDNLKPLKRFNFFLSTLHFTSSNFTNFIMYKLYFPPIARIPTYNDFTKLQSYLVYQSILRIFAFSSFKYKWLVTRKSGARMFTYVLWINWKCTKKNKINSSNLIIRAGVNLVIPLDWLVVLLTYKTTFPVTFIDDCPTNK